MAIEKDKLIDMYRTMVRIRLFEEKIAEDFAAGKIPGFVHLSAGQEANATGVCANLRPDDIITTTHRGHGHIIAKAGNQYSLAPMVAELYGKKSGVNKGKAGSQHLSDLEIGVLVAEGIQGTALTLAGGAALAAKLKATDQVVVTFIGDGTLNTGRFHEGMNMASTWKLPLICYCENNIWAESTNIYDVTNLTNITDRAVAFNIPGVSVDGNDVLAVYKVAAEAVARARKGEGPTFIEGKTCRRFGHFEGDTHLYRSQKEKDECMKRDPIPRFRKKLIEMGVLTDKEADKIHQEVQKEMEEAVKFALDSPFPDPEDVLTDVFAEGGKK
ncbi:MAG: thiamine pyrophosphate-dependent dehydrogenase E1 component subunit alpha [Dehalococcoidia bacterium]|nr:MAG: thiamine pyrophosphate-dependent dehydrogenase E1 component subunit alpha [Dehalococcoidia bacterium]